MKASLPTSGHTSHTSSTLTPPPQSRQPTPPPPNVTTKVDRFVNGVLTSLSVARRDTPSNIPIFPRPGCEM